MTNTETTAKLLPYYVTSGHNRSRGITMATSIADANQRRRSNLDKAHEDGYCPADLPIFEELTHLKTD